MKQMYLFVTTFLCCSMGLFSQSPYVSRVVEYKPAPGQFINTANWGSPFAAQSLIGTTTGHVSLGAFGGYIVLDFDHSIKNDVNNPYGVDFTIIGNAFAGWAEPAIVYVMKDDNNNGIADDTWYQLKGSDYNISSTIVNYNLLYANPGGYADVPWRDNLNARGAVAINTYHTQPYYPSTDSFPNINASFQAYSGTLITGNIDDSNPFYIQSYALDYGYADNHPKQSGNPIIQPDNPTTSGTIEGAGSDAMKIEWAIDEQGNAVTLDEIDFVKIQTGICRMCGWLGEVSSEICGVVDVAPSTAIQASIALKSDNTNKAATKKQTISIYPTPSNKTSEMYNVYNVKGEKVLSIVSFDTKNLSVLENGIYQAKPLTIENNSSFQIIIE